jgi:NAD(P)-dependent dehydrogenase (short-subunit alcohol dehydrogenase family)
MQAILRGRNEVFRGKVALVTGGASGIGRALARALGAAGAHLLVTDIDGLGAQRVADEINARGGSAEAHEHDVRQPEAWERLMARFDSGRPLDYLFNNAGIAVGGEVCHMTEEDWRRIVDTNLWGVIHGTTAALRRMVPRRSGHIVNVASMSGLFPVPMTTAYSMTKHAVVGLSTCLRAELADLGIEITVICPGVTDTAIWEASPLRAVDRETTLNALPFRPYDVDRAAATILRGVARRQAMVVFPTHARLIWWANRLVPGVALGVVRLVVRYLRALNLPSSGTDG